MTTGKKKLRSPASGNKNARQKAPRKNQFAFNDAKMPSVSKLDEVEQLYHSNNFAEAFTSWSEIGQEPETQEFQIRYYRLGSFILSHLGKYVESEKNALLGLELDPDDFDFHFVLSFIYITLRDYAKCISHANKYLDLRRKAKSASALSASDEYLLLNYLGTAYQALDDLIEAEQAYRLAMEQAPSYHHPYVNLANLYIRARKFPEGESVIKAGLKKCTQVQELRLLKKSLEHRVTVSACMIVKNEEEMLPDCLNSVRNWVDEIIVVDTGSSDRTVEIAKSFGARVFYQPWEGDFSKPRNYSLAQATKDWIFIIDADEELIQEDIPLIRQVMAQDQFRLISINVYNVCKETGDVTSFLPSYRLYKREAGFKYDGIVHNQLKYNPDEPALRVGIRLKHYGYSLSPEKMKQKLARSRVLLEKQITENPEDPYPHFNYAQLLRGTGINLDKETCDLIIEHASRAVELTQGRDKYIHVHLMSLHQLITTNLCLKYYEEAERFCRLALSTRSDYLDALMSMGHIYSHMRRFADAKEYFEKYLDIQSRYDESQEKSNLILLYLRARHIAHYGLGLIALAEGNQSKALEYFSLVAGQYGRYLDTFLRLSRLFLERNNTPAAIEFAEKELQWHPDSALAHGYMGECLARGNETEKAEKHFEQATLLDPQNPEIFERAGCFYANKGDLSRAVTAFTKLNELVQSYPAGLKLLAKVFFDMKEYPSALTAFNKYLENNPADAEVLNDAANCYYRLNDFEKAEQYYQKAISTGSNLAAAYRNLGLAKMKLGKLDESLPFFETYLKTVPDDFEIELAIGAIFAQRGRFGEAIPHYENYLKNNPGSIEALFGISECYFQLGHTDSAIIGYGQILKLKPDFRPALERLAQINSVGVPA